MPRWIPTLIAALIGLALGILYGWRIDPVQYTDITPEVLRVDYRTDFVLMVAEAYHLEQDPALAAQRLAVFGSHPPALIAGEAYDYARQTAYAAEDLNLIQELTVALQSWQPGAGASQP